MKKILLSLLLVLSVLSINVSADSNWDMTDVAVDKAFTVTFNSELNEDTVNNQNIYVADKTGNIIENISVHLSENNNKKVIVENLNEYKQGDVYYLIISNNVKSAKGVKLKNEVKMEFVITDGIIEITDITGLSKYIDDLKNQLTAKDKEIAVLKEKIKELEDEQNSTPPASELSKTINGVTVQIDKVIQNSDSLKIYVTYTNNTEEEIMTGDSLSKIVADGTQYEYESDFNFDRWYDQNVPHADSFIEPGVSEKSVIFFKPVQADTINIVLNADWEYYRFNNINIEK